MKSNTAFICAGLVSLEDKPYLPPIISILLFLSADTTSRYKGSPLAAGSLVLSNTAIFLTLLGITSSKCLLLKGLYKWTSTIPYLFPKVFKYSTVSLIVSHTLPIAIIILSASLSP